MNTVTDGAEVSAADKVPTSSFRRRGGALLVSAVVVVAIALSFLSRPRGATPDQFAAFSQKLGTLSAPPGSFTTYNPHLSPYLGSVPPGSWSLIATDTWSSTDDPSWWTAVRGWEITVPVGQDRVVCGDALAWLASSGSELGLTTSGENENLSACLSIIDTVRSGAGTVNDSWGGRGTQLGDGQLRYRTGVETFTGTRRGDVVIRVTAEASVANR